MLDRRVCNTQRALALSILSACSAVLLLSGCAYVEQTDHDGITRRSFAFVSPVTVIAAGADANRAVRVTGLGAGFGAGTFGLGYYRTSMVQIDPDCRIVLIDSTAAELGTLASLIGGTGKLCNITTNKGKSHAPS